ncbi:hypothetical protein O7622_01230 [Micromonospora sp. WMMD1076]|uniref:hypothetical protein n=1 Tax=Micromonospora sp. WMMD1076 TaxID=3016103 RepID=UPI00249B6C42|nr:hypothetical protein [Micromonospora sp. WMMD1076]WFF07253.1 hypothetical protein O7622_01230 [Micromonospora sp. WMMD1076]
MDFVLVSQRLALAGAEVAGIVRADPMVPDSISEPHLYVGEWTINYDQTYGGLVDAEVIVRVLTSRADDMAGQERLKDFMRRTGPTSVKARFEADPTLGGACQDLHVRQFRGHRQYQVGEKRYYGGEWPVRVIGIDSEEG